MRIRYTKNKSNNKYRERRKKINEIVKKRE